MPFKKPHHTAEQEHKKEDGDKWMIMPRGLNIVWGKDSRYWKIPAGENDPAELIQVSWLEVSGVVKIKSPRKYRVQFEVRVKEDGFGWDGTDVLVMAKVGKKGKYLYEVTQLSPKNTLLIIPNHDKRPLEINVEKANTELHFGLYEVWSGKWKGGLEIVKAEILPV